MAVETLIATVDTAGGADFSSLSACEADGTLAARNYITEDIIPVVECKATGAAADTTATTWNGWSNLDATHYLILRCPTGHRHAGVWDTSKYRLSPNGAVNALRLDNDSIQTDYLQVENSGAQTNAVFRPQSTSQKAICTLFRSGTGAGAQTISSTQDNVQAQFINCLIQCRNATGTAFIDTSSSTGAAFRAYNCTIVGIGGTAFSTLASPTNTNIARNCIVSGFTNFKSAAAMNAATNYNSTNLATGGGGANSRVSQTFTFVNAAGGNWHLDNADTGAKGHGEDLSALGFTTDIDGTTRGAVWDIGFDQITTSGTDVTVNPTGVGGTGSVGTVAVSGEASNTPTGISATGSVGDETVSAASEFSPTGIGSSSANGTPGISGGSELEIGGVGATGSFGDPSVTTDGTNADVDADGREAEGSVGEPIVTIVNPPVPAAGGGKAVRIQSRDTTPRYGEIETPKPQKKKRVITPKVETPKPRVSIDQITNPFGEKKKAEEVKRVDCVVPVVGLSFTIRRSAKPKLEGSPTVDAKGLSAESNFGIASVVTWSPPTANEIADLLRDDLEAIAISMKVMESFDQEEEKDEYETVTTIDDEGPKPRKRHVKVLRDETGAISGLDITEE